jgi:threonine dehydrogenase-like Zn-dependent dehydrogenase
MADQTPTRGSGEMLAMVLTNDRKTRLERREDPTPREDQVLVDVDLCGICGSDLDAPDLTEVYLGEASKADRAFDPTVEAAAIEGVNADVVLECSGSEAGMRSSVAAARPEGTVVVVGGGRAGLEQIAIMLKELRVLGSFTYADEFAEVIALLTDRALQVSDLTSEIASIHDAPAAFERLRDASTMKILIAPNGP